METMKRVRCLVCNRLVLERHSRPIALTIGAHTTQGAICLTCYMAQQRADDDLERLLPGIEAHEKAKKEAQNAKETGTSPFDAQNESNVGKEPVQTLYDSIALDEPPK